MVVYWPRYFYGDYFMTGKITYLGLAFVLLAILPADLPGQTNLPKQVEEVRIDQRLGAQVPLHLHFRDEVGRPIRLRDYVHDKPIILVLAYYRCPRLCSVILNNLIESLRKIPARVGTDFDVVIVSFDPEETHELAQRNKQLCLQRYGGGDEAEQGWHFLTGEETEIRPLADAVGFHYIYDPSRREYRHGSGIMILTPEGKVARYLFGVDFAPRDIQMALIEASQNQISSPVENVLLLTCLAYDPARGKYTLAVMKLMRTACIATVFLLGSYVGWHCWRERRKQAVAMPAQINDEAAN